MLAFESLSLSQFCPTNCMNWISYRFRPVTDFDGIRNRKSSEREESPCQWDSLDLVYVTLRTTTWNSGQRLRSLKRFRIIAMTITDNSWRLSFRLLLYEWWRNDWIHGICIYVYLWWSPEVRCRRRCKPIAGMGSSLACTLACTQAHSASSHPSPLCASVVHLLPPWPPFHHAAETSTTSGRLNVNARWPNPGAWVCRRVSIWFRPENKLSPYKSFSHYRHHHIKPPTDDAALLQVRNTW